LYVLATATDADADADADADRYCMLLYLFSLLLYIVLFMVIKPLHERIIKTFLLLQFDNRLEVRHTPLSCHRDSSFVCTLLSIYIYIAIYIHKEIGEA